MKTIISTYPDFQSLPKGLKQLLVVSESFFFEKSERAAVDARASRWLDAKIAQFPKMADVTPPVKPATPAYSWGESCRLGIESRAGFAVFAMTLKRIKDRL